MVQLATSSFPRLNFMLISQALDQYKIFWLFLQLTTYVVPYSICEYNYTDMTRLFRNYFTNECFNYLL